MQSRGWTVSWLGTPTAWRTASCRRAASAMDTITFSGAARQGPGAHADRRAAPARRVLELPADRAAAPRERGARHGRLRLLSGRHDGLAARQAARAGERRRAPAAQQQGAAAGGRPRRVRLRRRGDEAAQARRRHRQPGARRDRSDCRLRRSASPAAAARCACSWSAAASGAKVLNDTLPQALALLDAAQRPQVTHQTGAAQLDAVRTAYAQAGRPPRCCRSSTTWRSAWPTAT